MIQTCTPDYRAGAARPDLPSCGMTFDDVDRSTLCPHEPLGPPAFGDDVRRDGPIRTLDPAAYLAIAERIERLDEIVERWDRPGDLAGRRLARRARDKADGLRTALRLLELTS